MDISFRTCTSIADLEEIQQLEAQVWDMPPTPVPQSLTNALNGGSSIGAWHGSELVGFSFGFPGFKQGHTYLCSHLLGVRKDWRKKGLGARIKWEQRRCALEMGYDMVTWTFDPLESVNANLNLNKLHGICGEYDENHYGVMDDGLNTGLPTDRFTLEWWIKSGYVNKWPQWLDAITYNPNALCMNTVAKPGAVPKPGDKRPEWEGDFVLVPVPLNFQEIKQHSFDLALEWRIKTREIICEQLEKGRKTGRLLKRPDLNLGWYVFVDGARLTAAAKGTNHE